MITNQTMMIMTTEGMTSMINPDSTRNYSADSLTVRKLVQQTVAEKDLATVRGNLSALVHLLDSTNSKTGACSLLLAIAQVLDDEINAIELRDVFGISDQIDYPEDDLIFKYVGLSEPVAILR